MSPKKFSVVMVSVSATLFSMIAIANFLVNPYAQYATTLVPPIVQTSRASKVELMSAADRRPDGLILGSSRVLKIEPKYLGSKLNCTFFNAGVNYGKPEDSLALMRFYHSRFGRFPRTIVLGLDVHGFSPRLPIDSRLLANKDLARQIPDIIPLSDRFYRWKELLSWQQSIATLKSLKRWHKSEGLDASESFQPDGLLVYHLREKQRSEGTYDFAAALDYNKREYTQLFAGYEALSEQRCHTFQNMVEVCQKNDTRLVVFLTPMHPKLISHLADTNYGDRLNDLKSFLVGQAEREHFVFCDFSTIATFDGDPENFVDGIHPLEPNTRKIIDRMVLRAESEDRYAVQ